MYWFIKSYNLCLVLFVLLSVSLNSLHCKTFQGLRHQIDNKLGDLSDERNQYLWKFEAQLELKKKIERPLNTNVAKNVIMFLGDGMSIPTMAAARAYMGQKLGLSGEEVKLSFEDFPFTGLSKTYCLDRQVADSGCSASAYLCGVKANYATVGVGGGVRRGNCSQQADPAHHLTSIAHWAQRAGKDTGLVTTTRVTHASPAGLYAHAADRDWESDVHVRRLRRNLTLCPDIATQLITQEPGRNFKVILGGGRKLFYSRYDMDQEGHRGFREDGKDLIKQWLDDKKTDKLRAEYVYNRDQLMQIDPKKVDCVLGLFEPDHMKYHLEANSAEDPTLAEMTQKAIQLLQNGSDKGFFLFVEGGRIDMAHHETKARKALDETSELSKAVSAALAMVNSDDTLIVVTADHSHTMSYSGYNRRGSDILGLSQDGGIDRMPYSILSYANGPSFPRFDQKTNRRRNLLLDNIYHPNYTFPALFPLRAETHGGEDVAVFAHGPWAHLFTGNFEQSYIPHAMSFATCVGEGLTACMKP